MGLGISMGFQLVILYEVSFCFSRHRLYQYLHICMFKCFRNLAMIKFFIISGCCNPVKISLERVV